MEEEQTILRKDKENGVWLNRGNQDLNVNTFKYFFLSPPGLALFIHLYSSKDITE